MTNSSTALTGRIAWVTGGAGGIGRAIVARLAQQGANVGVIDISEQQAAEVAAEVAGASAVVDVSDPAAVAAMVEKLSAEQGPPDILVNAAGIAHNEAVADHDPAVWQRILDINLTGPFLLTRLLHQGMLNRGFGRIVNITSASAVRVGAGVAAYGASKAGLIAFTKALANEGAKAGVTANAVAPGLVDTAMTREHMPQTEMLELAAQESAIANPMGVVLQPQDIAHAVAFLCHPDSRFITGQVIHVNAGGIMLGS